VRLGGPAATAGLLAAGLGAPGLIALAAGSGGLTAAHLLTRSRRRPAAPAAAALGAGGPAPAPDPAPVASTATSPAATAPPLAGVLRPSEVAHLNGTSTNGSHKEPA